MNTGRQEQGFGRHKEGLRLHFLFVSLFSSAPSLLWEHREKGFTHPVGSSQCFRELSKVGKHFLQSELRAARKFRKQNLSTANRLLPQSLGPLCKGTVARHIRCATRHTAMLLLSQEPRAAEVTHAQNLWMLPGMNTAARVKML